jgi:Icc protein
VVQITDSHLFRLPTDKLLGLNTEESLLRVLALVQSEQEQIDAILVTGDVSQDGSVESYERFNEYIKQFGKPVYWLPGNHDELKQMQALVSSAEFLSPCCVNLGAWQIVMLDSAVPGKVPGELDEVQLGYLESALQAASASDSVQHIMVCLHHHPIPLESRWLDGVALKNPEPLFDIIDRFDSVRAVVWGHVHQAFEGRRGGVGLYACPSTCVQFEPRSADFAVCDSAPGYRWFDLHPNGEIKTGVSLAQNFSFQVDYSVKGY